MYSIVSAYIPKHIPPPQPAFVHPALKFHFLASIVDCVDQPFAIVVSQVCPFFPRSSSYGVGGQRGVSMFLQSIGLDKAEILDFEWFWYRRVFFTRLPFLRCQNSSQETLVKSYWSSKDFVIGCDRYQHLCAGARYGLLWLDQCFEHRRAIQVGKVDWIFQDGTSNTCNLYLWNGP